MTKSYRNREAGGAFTGFPLIAENIKISFMAFAFVGMALGLVGSCNTGIGGASGALASTAEANELLHWQIRSYSKMISDDPERILELTGTEVSSILQIPSLERRDDPSVVWQYMDNECVLDIYFISGEDGDVSGRTPVHYETRSRSGEDADASSCIKNLVMRESGTGIQLAKAVDRQDR